MRLQYASTHLSRWAPDITGTTSQPWSPGEQPLETLVEREARSPVGTRGAAEAGMHFLAMLGDVVAPLARAAYVERYRFAAPTKSDDDPDARRLGVLFAGRAIDGVRLAADLTPTLLPATGAPALPAVPTIDAGERDEVIGVTQAWLTWYRADCRRIAVGSRGNGARGTRLPRRRTRMVRFRPPTGTHDRGRYGSRAVAVVGGLTRTDYVPRNARRPLVGIRGCLGRFRRR